MDASQRQKGNEGPRWWTAAISEEIGPEEATTGRYGKCYQDLHEDHMTGDHEANCQMYCWVTRYDGPEIVEGFTPFEMEKKLHTEQELVM
jgi:hypothetical protein